MTGERLLQAVPPAIPSPTARANPGDAALQAKVAAGDAAAFGVLVDRHSPMAFRVACRMLGDRSEAEDVVQDAFTRLWINAASLDFAAGPGGWLHRVTVNLCFDRLRRRRFVADVAVPDIADDAPGADLAHDRARLAAVTSAAIARLPDRQRAAIILTHYEQFANAAAAAALGLNIKAFESLLLRARAALRVQLAESGIVPGSLS